MLDLVVQAPGVPGHKPVAAGKVHGRFHLVNGPRILHSTRAFSGHREVRLLDTVSQLEDDTEHQALDERRREEEQQHDVPRMQQHRDHQRQGDKQQLSGYENNQLPAPWAREPGLADPFGDNAKNVIEELPLERHEPVQHPQVNVL